MTRVITFVFAVLFLVWGCGKESDLPPEPEIEFVSFEIREVDETNHGFLTISFRDGDGDIGLDPLDTFPPHDPGNKYYNNLFLDLYYKINGEWVPWEPAEPGLDYHTRIADITPEGRNKALEGEIEYNLGYFEVIEGDTMMFEIYLVDRELNYSNIVQSDEIY